jgi:hypothetical protein
MCVLRFFWSVDSIAFSSITGMDAARVLGAKQHNTSNSQYTTQKKHTGNHFSLLPTPTTTRRPEAEEEFTQATLQEHS